MNKHLSRILTYIKLISQQLKEWFMELTIRNKVLVIVTLLVAIFIVSNLFGGKTITEEVVNAPRAVTLVTLNDLANGEAGLPLLGTVTSVSEATIRSESSGKLTRVYRKLGDFVSAGQVIAEFENSAERASVLQAEGAYDAAKAARDIARINSGTTNTSLTDTKQSALNAISNAYVTMDDSIRVKTDAAYKNPRNDDLRFIVSVPDSALVLSLETKRKLIEKTLLAREARNKTLTTSSDLQSELQQVQNEVQTVKLYLDDLATAYAKAIPDNTFTQVALDGNKVTVGGVRSVISGTINSLVGAKTALSNSSAAQEIAGKTSGQGDTGVTTADAGVKQALGVYQGALSRLEKTVIRSPISGTLNSLSIETGDFIQSFTEIGVVSNNGSLEVVTYVTEDNKNRAIVGTPVVIDGNVKGVITRVAGALDPRTKKIEVRIGITDKQTKLINGQSVRIEVTTPVSKNTTSKTQVKKDTPANVPLSALKITPKGNLVFTVDASSTLVAIPVTIGALLGDEIQILDGLDANVQIVKDARGLKEGQSVTISE